MEEEGRARARARARAWASSSRALTRLLVLFLCLSHLLSCLAVPATRNLNTLAEAASSSDQDLQLDQEEGDMYEVTEGRMDVEESTDYPGTGANNHHDPKSPGRV